MVFTSPPSARIAAPLVTEARGLARKATILAISSVWANLRMREVGPGKFEKVLLHLVSGFVLLQGHVPNKATYPF
jgi:hypothetical protein